MRRIVTCILLLVCLISMFTGCSGQDTAAKGIINEKGREWYIVQLPEGKNVSDYFTLLGGGGTVVMTNMGHMDKNETMGIAYYSKVKEGGWLAYSGNKFMYIPSELSVEEAKSACTTFILNSDNCMTFENAQKYISFLS